MEEQLSLQLDLQTLLEEQLDLQFAANHNCGENELHGDSDADKGTDVGYWL